MPGWKRGLLKMQPPASLMLRSVHQLQCSAQGNIWTPLHPKGKVLLWRQQTDESPWFIKKHRKIPSCSKPEEKLQIKAMPCMWGDTNGDWKRGMGPALHCVDQESAGSYQDELQTLKSATPQCTPIKPIFSPQQPLRCTRSLSLCTVRNLL